MLATLTLTASVLGAPEWQAGVKHAGCAGYLHEIWALPEHHQAAAPMPREAVLDGLVGHVKASQSLITPLLAQVDPSSNEARVLSGLIGLPLTLREDVLFGALLSTTLQNTDLEKELALTKVVSPLDVAVEAAERYSAQGCAEILEAAE